MKRLPSNWRNRIEIIKRICDDDEIHYILQFKKGKTPKGYFKSIGYINVNKIKKKAWVADVEIEEKFRGRGLGNQLYRRALKDHGSLSTAYAHTSFEARRVWKSLMKSYRFETDFFTNRLTVYID